LLGIGGVIKIVSSACDILLSEPQRFVDYLFADQRLRSKIVDKRSFVDALEKALNSDTSLRNIPIEIHRKGESIEICGENIFNHNAIQDIIKRNIASKRKEISGRVKKKYPSWTRTEKLKETNRRLNIFISTASQKVKETKQVTLTEAFSPVKVGEYKRGSQTVSSYRKTKSKHLTTQEEMLIENAVRKGKMPADVVTDYLQAGLGYRTKTSIRRHYYRIRNRINP